MALDYRSRGQLISAMFRKETIFCFEFSVTLMAA